MTTAKTSLDCVEMKRYAQERILRETEQLSGAEELAYFHRAAQEFREEQRRIRTEIASGRRTPTLTAGR